MKAKKFISTWLLIGCAMIIVMIMIGGITRLTDSGLSITEWAVVKGTLPPLNDQAWEEAFDKYKQIPEYELRHSHYTLEDFKRIYFWEYIHRLWGRLMGFVFAIPFAVLLLRKKLSSRLKRRGWIILFGGGAVGALGWFMVKSGLADNPDVSHFRLAIHLCAALSLFSFVFWTYLLVTKPYAGTWQQQLTKRSKALLRLVIGLLVIQITYGAFTAGIDAGVIYNTWPLMNGSFMPENVTAFDSFWTNFADHKDGIQFIHRYLAILLAVVVIVLAFRIKREVISGRCWFWLLTAVIIQFVLGVVTLLDAGSGDVSVLLGTLHQLGAVFLLMQVLLISFQLWAKPLATND